MLLLLSLACGPAKPEFPTVPPPQEVTVSLQMASASLCGGPSPAVSWSGLPEGTESLALTLVAPSDQGPWVHWMAWDIPADAGGLTAGVLPTRAPPTQGLNSRGAVGYDAPCPSRPTRLELRLFALPAPLGLAPTTTWGELGAAIQPHTLAWGLATAEVTGADN